MLMGDSHLGYNQSRSAGTGAQVARLIGMPVSVIWKEGLSTQIPVQVARDRFIRKRRVIVVHYTERMMVPKPGKHQWPIVNLPGAPKPKPVPRDVPPELAAALGLGKSGSGAVGKTAFKEPVAAIGTVKQASPKPDV